MKTNCVTQSVQPLIRRFLGKTALLGLLAACVAAQADPFIYPINSKPFGKTYGEWSAEHWKWVYSLPADAHPLTDTADCSTGQSGPVWFIGGSFAPTVDLSGNLIGNAVRDCTVPADKTLFFPIINAEGSTAEGNGTTRQELGAFAQYLIDHAEGLSCTIDGIPVRNLEAYRARSPLFTFGPLPENNLLGLPAGTSSPAVADGYYVMLSPLSPGQHTIHFTGAVVFTAEEDGFDFSFSLDITYHLTVQ